MVILYDRVIPYEKEGREMTDFLEKVYKVTFDKSYRKYRILGIVPVAMIQYFFLWFLCAR